jgi:ribosomal protein S21
MNGKVINNPEEEVYRRLKKKVDEENQVVIEMMREKYIRMEMDKGRSKEEAEADWDKLSSVMTRN